MTTPYASFPQKAFWRPAVAEPAPEEIRELWVPKFRIGKRRKISTYGSCFAQHIGRAFAARDFNWYLAEPVPEGLSKENAKRFNYGIFTSRTGNIYTTSLLLQWVNWSLGHAPMPEEVWEQDGRFYDPFRPAVEPNGFASLEELRRSQQGTLEAFRSSIEEAAVFVFTLGLTEKWVNTAGQYEYPMCPGTVAGTFDPETHVFRNMGFKQVVQALKQAIKLMRAANPKLKILLTVSPVPLTATASGNHVLVATTQSKSILRAAAAELATSQPYIDYFPSYEIITAPVFRGAFFEANLRSVKAEGVAFVMENFFRDLGARFPEIMDAPETPAAGSSAARKTAPRSLQTAEAKEDDLVCEEALLDAFGASDK